MDVSYDPAKRAKTLAERGLDFDADGRRLFSGEHVTAPSPGDYGEDRYVSAGYVDGRLIIVAWTPRGEHGQIRHIFSMRHCHAKEERLWRQRMG